MTTVMSEEQKQKVRISTQVRLPVELFAKVEEVAKAANTTAGLLIQGLVAREFNFTLPSAGQRPTKYANKEERKEAQKARNKDRRELVKQLLEEYQAQQVSTAPAA